MKNIYETIIEVLQKARIGFNVGQDCFKNLIDKEFKPEQSNDSDSDTNSSDKSQSDTVN